MLKPTKYLWIGALIPQLAFAAPQSSSPRSTSSTTTPDPSRPETMPGQINPPPNVSQPSSGTITRPGASTKKHIPPRNGQNSRSRFPGDSQRVENQQRPMDQRTRPQEGLEREQERSRAQDEQVKPINPPVQTE